MCVLFWLQKAKPSAESLDNSAIIRSYEKDIEYEQNKNQMLEEKIKVGSEKGSLT